MYDLVVIGAGPGGYTAAIKAAKNNLKVALIEKSELGGTCINEGCIPTKVYAHAASVINNINEGNEFGITSKYNFDMNKLHEKKNRVIEELNFGLNYLMENNNIDVIKGEAEFLDESSIIVNGVEYKSKNFIIATGSNSMIPPINGIENNHVIYSKEALEIVDLPKDLLIVGGGVIGLEFAFIFNSFGCNVVIAEALPEILPNLDNEIVEVYKDIIKSKGIKLMLDSKVETIYEDFTVEINNNKKTEQFIADKIIIATGRKPNINGIDKLGLEYSNKGIKVDSSMRTNISNIYCIGDVNGISQLAHVASYQADIAVKNIIGDNCSAHFKAIPNCIYTDPEVSFVGISEKEAKKIYDDVKIGLFPFSYSGRSKTMGSNKGLVKIVSGGEYNQILGAQIVGKDSSEIINELVLAIKYDFSINEIIDSIHAHPTLSEAIKEACEDVLKLSANRD